MIKKRNLDQSLIDYIDSVGLGLLGMGKLLAQRVNYSKSKVYYVDVHNGSDTGNDGESPETAFASIGQATTIMNARIDWAESPWARQDTMVVFPGTYAENLTALPYGCQIIGLGHDIRDAQFGVKIKPASGDPVDVNALINTSIYNVCFESPGTVAAFDAAILNNCHFQKCMFTGPAETATITAAFVTNDCVKTTFERCWFCNADKGFDANYVDGGDSISYLEMLWCYFTGIDTAGIEISSNLVGPHSMVNRCFFMGGGQTMATGILDNSAILDVNGCYFKCTDAVNGVRSVNGSYMANALVT